MTKAFGVLVLAMTVSGSTSHQQNAPAPTRPDYSGSWTVAEDRGASNAGVLGKDLKVSQSTTAVTIETTMSMVSPVRTEVSGVRGARITAIRIPTEYIFDGLEHELVLPLPTVPGANTPPRAQAFLAPLRTYRATWVGGQLIIVTQVKSAQGLEKGALTFVTRMALSLGAEGSLIADSLTVPLVPDANGPKQEPPLAVRSVYKKAP